MAARATRRAIALVKIVPFVLLAAALSACGDTQSGTQSAAADTASSSEQSASADTVVSTDAAHALRPGRGGTWSSAPPTISGTPASQVQAGQTYSFTPTAHDRTSATLSFSIQNMPAWANFSIATGALSGTPSSNNVGTYSGIVISVSNGTSAAALPGFTITVSSPPAPPSTTGTATLTWAAPTTNTDGSPLTDLSGYSILYGTSPSTLSETISVANAAATSYTVQGLTSGTWYFALVALASDGTQSAPSSVMSKAIQ